MAFSISGKGYLGGGNVSSTSSNGTPVNDFYVYEPSTNSWNFQASIGDRGRQSAVTFVINNKGYVAWGSDKGSIVGDDDLDQTVYEFDPNFGTTGSWTRKADFPGPSREHGQVFVLGNSAYLNGGWAFDQKYGVFFGGTVDETWKYTPSSNNWNMVSSASPPLYKGTSFAVAGKGYLVGGSYPCGPHDQQECKVTDIFEFDPSTYTWTVIDQIPFDYVGEDPLVSFLPCDYTVSFGNTSSRSFVRWNIKDISMIGEDEICTSNTTFSLENLPSSIPVNWYVSPASLFSIDNGSGNSFTTRATSSSSTGTGTIKAIIAGECGEMIFEKSV